nr:TonB-dependent receptor plug domain-containing protein [Bacteroidota bacterium]
MGNKAFFIILLVFFVQFFAFGQGIRVDADNKPLNSVLVEIRDTYDIGFSFDDQLLSGYKVTLSKTFPNAEEAIKEIIGSFPLAYEKSGDVFIIFAIRQPKKKEPVYHLSGQVLDATSSEPLPYSHVIINGIARATDLKGSFAHISKSDSVFSIRVSQLGYYILDTIVQVGSDKMFYLAPSVIGLNEVVITGKAIEKSTQIGTQAGMEKLNHKVANYLPGYGDNSVFNLLRLQPGILASGEQTNDLIIWGSYAGHSKVMFDGFTIYGLKNFNDNISAFNPLMAKDIEVYKGGYDARFGERVGGIVNITGKNGGKPKPSFEFCVNNMTMNGMVELPVSKKSTLLVSFRQTYYDLYNPEDFNLFGRRESETNNGDLVTYTVVPDYMFRDLNIKYSAQTGNNDLFYVSLYGGNDNFSYSINEPYQNVKLLKDTEEENSQAGGSVFYGKSWATGNTTNFLVSYSGLQSVFKNDFRARHNFTNKIYPLQNLKSDNGLDEVMVSVDNRFVLQQNQTFEAGAGYIYNHSTLVEDTFDVNLVNINHEARRTFVYFQNVITNSRQGNFKIGFRMNYAHNMQKLYFEPRISASISMHDDWKLNGAWGIYNQFVVKTSVVDEYGNYRYLWAVSNGDDVPVASAMHLVLGTSYHRNDFTFSMEGFYKSTTGLTRYIRSQAFNIEGVFEGKSLSYGIDLMLQKEYRGHQAWIAYTLSKVEEHFNYQIRNIYRRAPQDQRHEVKLAGLVNLDPFYISANYVFGSGFPAGIFSLQGVEDDHNYSRLDVSFIYQFLDRK